MNVEQLNQAYGIPGVAAFSEGPGDLPMLRIDNGKARALISVYAGQLLSYLPAGEREDMMFLSEHAYYAPGKAIKGGVPICWPWFGPDPEGQGRPAHGFVRNRLWQVRETGNTASGDTRVVLGMVDDEDTRKLWPQAFDLSLEIVVGDSLGMTLTTRNTGSDAFTIGQALHTYFRIGDIDQVRVLGLEGAEYIDKVDGGQSKAQQGAITIGAEVDRVYASQQDAELVIEDSALGRRLTIATRGSRTAVVWNPWATIAASMADLDDEDYRRFVCVETANAADDVMVLAPGASHSLAVDYRLSHA